MEWGVGIEHEILMTDDKKKKIKGVHLKLHLDSIYGETSHVARLIDDNNAYKIITPIYKDIYTILEFFNTNPIPEILKQLLLEYEQLFVDPDARHGYDHTDLILNDLCSSIVSNEETVYFTMLEFTTPINFFMNKTITTYIDELNLKQKIILNAVQIILDKDRTVSKLAKYTEYGSIFPIYNFPDVVMDYTGSYHLNLSLPYLKSDLDSEELRYNQKIQSIRSNFRSMVNKVKSYSGLNKYKYLSINSNISRFFNDMLKVAPHKSYAVIYDRIYNDIQQLNYNVQNMNPFYLHLFETDWNFPDSLDISQKTPLRSNVIYYRKVYDKISIYLKTKSSIKSKVPFLKLLYTINNQESYTKSFFNIIEKTLGDDIRNDYIWFRLGDMRNFNYRIFTDSQNIEMEPWKYMDSTSTYKRPFPSKLNNELIIIQNHIKDYIQNQVSNEILTQIEHMEDDYNSPISTVVRYEYSNYHKLHKIWAIGIQWVLPLLLSCFSSCDPLSIGDNDKLSELSLRIFISEYAPFINLNDIKNDNIQEMRLTNKLETNESLTSKVRDAFDYTSVNFEGNEFRRYDRGFNFGFELRIFDNFNTDKLSGLIEFLFLLADHVVYLGKTYTMNPFNNPILINETMNLLKQGWNTVIGNEYIDILNIQLNLKLISEPTLAYDVINNIYRYLQKRYIGKTKGKGKGPYSNYLINRGKGIKNLPNINRSSWNSNFNKLVWGPNSQIRTDIENVLKTKSPETLYDDLKVALGENYNNDIGDIITFLQDKKIIG